MFLINEGMKNIKYTKCTMHKNAVFLTDCDICQLFFLPKESPDVTGSFRPEPLFPRNNIAISTLSKMQKNAILFVNLSTKEILSEENTWTALSINLRSGKMHRR